MADNKTQTRHVLKLERAHLAQLEQLIAVSRERIATLEATLATLEAKRK
jgi:hypothetical protein